MTEPAGSTPWWSGLPPNLRGAGWMILASAVYAGQALIVKMLGQRLDPFEVAFFRCAFGLIAVIPFLAGTRGMIISGNPWMHVLRSIVGVAGMFCGFYAITHLPLATATAISFTKPLFLIVLAVLFLGETVRWRRWTATAIGFLGVLIVVRPGSEVFSFAMLVALAGSFFIADVAVLVKKLSETDRNVTILFYFGVITTAVSAVPALFVWQNPTLFEWPLLLLVGAGAALAQYFSLRSLRIAEATAVMPYDYTRLLFAGFFGYLFFAEIPDFWTLVGIAVLIGSTLYIAHREMRLGVPARGASGG
ncbi:MAG: DMT family transporter [Alphaproteobacteria bacterium]|nr:DMT family transporter [Alphaproteobacteria bacterium]